MEEEVTAHTQKLANGLKEAGSAYTYAAEAPERPVLIKEIIE